MATIAEKYISHRGREGEEANDHERRYIITEAADVDDVLTTLAATAPITFRGEPRIDLDYEEVDAEAGLYEGIAKYGTPANVDLTTDPDGISFAFDTTGGTRHITQSLENVSTTDVSGTDTTLDFGGAVGVGQDGSIAGVDIVVADFKWTETKVYESSEITTSFIRNIFELTGKVNSDPVVSTKVGQLEGGECLFLGATGSTSATDEFTVTYHFAGSPNRSNVILNLPSATINIGTVRGFEYVWVHYEDEVDTNTGKIRPTSKQVNVERVYEEADLSQLDIFDAPPPPEP